MSTPGRAHGASTVGNDGLRIAVLVKQVPRLDAMRLGADGRLVREGVELELNPYCRRAVSKGVELARATGGSSVVITLGPPSAEDVLREALAWGVEAGVLVTDPVFAGSDTLATARTLAAALELLGPFDLVLAGRNSIDADTGQVGPELAELLCLPFLAGVRELDIRNRLVVARLEHDDGWAQVEVALPALLSCAERLCDPAKVDPGRRAAVPAGALSRLSAPDLGSGPWGQAGSPTSVGEVRVLAVKRQRRVLSGCIEEQAELAVTALRDAGALESNGSGTPFASEPAEMVPPHVGHSLGGIVAVLVEPDRPRVARELLGGAARVAIELGASVAALVPDGERAPSMVDLSAWGADEVVVLDGVEVEEDVALAVATWCGERSSLCSVIAASTMWGREVAARVAARLGAGLTGDAVDLAVRKGRVVGWKPAFGGRLVAAIECSSNVAMTTVRPGMLPLLGPRTSASQPVISRVRVAGASRVHVVARVRDDDFDSLATATAVVAVGAGVTPDGYGRLAPLLAALGAELAATRKVTDNGWLPRARQVGITGRSIAPRLYVAIGLAGKFNHSVGYQSAGYVLAINSDPDAPVFETADLGIVADWHEAVPALLGALASMAPSETSLAR